MRFRLAAIALTAAVCGFVAPSRADEAKTDLSKYVPEGAGVYVHVNVQQLLAAPVVRKAIPLAMNKYGDTLMGFAQMAKAFDPNAANVPNDKIKAVIDELKKPETIAKAFDAAKDAITDIVVAGDPSKEEAVLVIVKCHEAVTADLVKNFVPLLNGNPQLQLKTTEKGGKTIFEATVQKQKTFYFAMPANGVVVGGPSKDLVEKALAGGANGLKADLKKLVGERKSTDFLFFAMTGKGKDESGVVTGWGRLDLGKDISGEMSGTFANAEKAAAHAKEMDEHIGELADKVKEAVGPAGKEIAAALNKAKPVVVGSTVTSKFSLPGSTVEKLLAKD